jgi:hypothetical protein
MEATTVVLIRRRQCIGRAGLAELQQAYLSLLYYLLLITTLCYLAPSCVHNDEVIYRHAEHVYMPGSKQACGQVGERPAGILPA